jgi:hypothetical protein
MKLETITVMTMMAAQAVLAGKNVPAVLSRKIL